MVATVAAIPAGSCHARHVSITAIRRRGNPSSPAPLGPLTPGVSLAPLCPVAMGHAIGTRSIAAAERGSEVGIAPRRRAAPSAGYGCVYAVDVIIAADVWYSAARRIVDFNQAGLLTQPHEHLA
jgi:hypothetical protein